MDIKPLDILLTMVVIGVLIHLLGLPVGEWGKRAWAKITKVKSPRKKAPAVEYVFDGDDDEIEKKPRKGCRGCLGGCFIVPFELVALGYVLVTMFNAGGPSLFFAFLAGILGYWLWRRVRQGSGLLGKLRLVLEVGLDFVGALVVVIPLALWFGWIGYTAVREDQVESQGYAYTLGTDQAVYQTALAQQQGNITVQSWVVPWLEKNNVDPVIWAAAVRASEVCRDRDGRPTTSESCVKVDPFILVGQKSVESTGAWTPIKDPTAPNRTGVVNCKSGLALRWAQAWAIFDAQDRAWKKIATQPGMIEQYGQDLYDKAYCSETGTVGDTQAQPDVFVSLMSDVIEAHNENPATSPAANPWDQTAMVPFEFLARLNVSRDQESLDSDFPAADDKQDPKSSAQANARARALERSWKADFKDQLPMGSLMPLNQLAQLPSGRLAVKPSETVVRTASNTPATSAQMRTWWSAYECGEGGEWTVPTLFGKQVGQVPSATLEAYQALVQALLTSGYVPTDPQTYNCRNIAGTNQRSLHAYGLAVDIDPALNPQSAGDEYEDGALKSANVAAVENIRSTTGQQVWYWGGHWTGATRDRMHFQLNVPPADLAEGIDWGTVLGGKPATAGAALSSGNVVTATTPITTTNLPIPAPIVADVSLAITATVPASDTVQLPTQALPTVEPDKRPTDGGPTVPGYIYPPFGLTNNVAVRKTLGDYGDGKNDNLFGVHGNACYINRESWFGTDFQSPKLLGGTSRDVFAPFAGKATSTRGTANGGNQVLIIGDGDWSGWVAHYLHMESDLVASGHVAAGQRIGQESKDWEHIHTILLYCKDPDNRASGCVDVPILALFPPEYWPQYFYLAPDKDSRDGMYYEGCMPGYDRLETELDAWLPSERLWTPLKVQPPSWESAGKAPPPNQYYDLFKTSPTPLPLARTGVTESSLAAMPALLPAGAARSSGDPRVGVDDETKTLPWVLDTRVASNLVPSLGERKLLVSVVPNTEILGMLAAVVPPAEMLEVKDSLPNAGWVRTPQAGIVRVIVPRQALEVFKDLGIDGPETEADAFAYAVAFGLEGAQNTLRGKVGVSGDQTLLAATRNLQGKRLLLGPTPASSQNFVVLPRLRAIGATVSKFGYQVTELLMLPLWEKGVIPREVKPEHLQKFFDLIKAAGGLGINLNWPPDGNAISFDSILGASQKLTSYRATSGDVSITNVVYAGVYGNLCNKVGTLGTVCSVNEALAASQKWGTWVQSRNPGKTSVNVLIPTLNAADEAMIQGIIVETAKRNARGEHWFVLLNLNSATPNSIKATAERWVTTDNPHVGIVIDLEWFGRRVPISEINSMAKAYFDVRQERALPGDGIFGIWYLGMNLTQDTKIVDEYENGYVVPIMDGFGGCAAKAATYSKMLSTFGSRYNGSMGFTWRWGTKYDKCEPEQHFNESMLFWTQQ